MFLVWHFVLFSRTLIQLKKVTQSINKNCNSTHLSKLVTKFITNYSVFFSLEQFFIISIANLRNLFTSIFALFRARFHLRGFLLYLVIFFFSLWLLKSYKNQSLRQMKAYFWHTWSLCSFAESMTDDSKQHPCIKILSPISGQCSCFIPPENTRKSGFQVLSAGIKVEH